MYVWKQVKKDNNCYGYFINVASHKSQNEEVKPLALYLICLLNLIVNLQKEINDVVTVHV